MVKKTQTTKSSYQELENKYRRALADYQNQERRHQEMSSAFIKMANAALIEKLLLNLDALQLAQTHLKDQGLQMVIDEFQSTFSEEGLSPIDSNGQDFNPLTMDCTEIVPGKKDKVVETVTQGYFLFDKVLRPAKVRVGSGTDSHPRESGDPLNGNGSGSPPVIARSETTRQSI